MSEKKAVLIGDRAKVLLEEIEKRRTEAKKQGMNFTGLTDEEIYRKLTRKNSPMIVAQGWNSAAPGGTVNYTVSINNPDPVRHVWLFGHVFVGLAKVASDVSDAVSAVDTRFPRLTLPDFDGLSIDSGATKDLKFVISIPANVERTNYLGNCFLFRATWHDPALYLDRGLFVFKVI